MLQIISEIQQKMLPWLTNEQMLHLREVLIVSLGAIMQGEANSFTQPQETDCVEAFLTAKRIEGCSEKTLRYYQATIAAMLEKVGKSPQQIVTDDLRAYLTEYQASRKSSRVTIDNIRRILSSFFAWLEDEDRIIKSPVRRIRQPKPSRTPIRTKPSNACAITVRRHGIWLLSTCWRQPVCVWAKWLRSIGVTLILKKGNVSSLAREARNV